ncbi:uncharacterized protein [Apostichopus japonicus]|uniref:uncharacterized protein isoform X2 n=1 Tax=Stichopus japonicus TaxID=307972 RepID=UPI003AB28565
MAVKFLFAGVIFIISFLVTVKLCACWSHMGPSIHSCVLYLVTGLLALIGILSGCALIFISTRRTSKHHTLLSALHHFIVKYHRLYVGSRMLKKFRAACKNPREAQELLLQKIIKKNKNTDYGYQFRLGEIHSLEDLRQKHPITDYDHYRRFINRLSKGEKDVLTAEKVSRLILTSGTTGTGIEIYSAMYISSEAFMGLNLWPFEDGTSEYALNLTENVFEFIKEEDMDKPNPKTYFVDEVEVGQKYELVLSQKYGFYRYRFGDLVKVTGFYQNSPKISFLYRKASILNLVGEKVDQHVIHDSLSVALNPWKDQVEMKHYTCAEKGLVPEQKNSQKLGLYYVFFLELKSNFGDELPDDLNTEILAEVIQKNLYERHEFYRVFNNTKQITTPTVYLTKEGAFTELKEYILANSSASRAQFKMPLKLRTREMAEFLLEHSLP